VALGRLKDPQADEIDGLLNSVDLSSYGLQRVKLNHSIRLDEEETEMEPQNPNPRGAYGGEDDHDPLDEIIRKFNEHWFQGWNVTPQEHRVRDRNRRIHMNRFSELTIKSYDIVGQKYHDLYKDELDSKVFDKELLNSFSKLLPQPAKVIDAGCGPSGHIGKQVFDLGHAVTGIDVSANCISIASNYNKGMNFKEMDMSKYGL